MERQRSNVMTIKVSRAERILVLAENYDPRAFMMMNGRAQQQQQNYSWGLPFQNQQPQPQQVLSWRQTKEVEDQLKRQNPDLLDSLRFAMDDYDYITLMKYIAKGAFWAAAIYASPFLVGPLIAGRAIANSRLKQIERRNMGIKPRYPLRPTDTY